MIQEDVQSEGLDGDEGGGTCIFLSGSFEQRRLSLQGKKVPELGPRQ